MLDETSDASSEESPEDADVEAEMLRMMQEEVGGEDGGGAAGAAAEGDQAEGTAGGGDAGSVDEMLEQEMLRAMNEETSGPEAAVAPFAAQPAGLAEAAEGLDRLSDVDVSITVEMGGNFIPIKDILSWTRDSIVELVPEEHEPVEVLVNGKLFARGEVVVVGDTFGVRIVELLDRSEETNP